MNENKYFINMTLTIQAYDEFTEFYNDRPDLYENEDLAEFSEIYNEIIYSLLVNQVNTLNQQLYMEIKRRESLIEQLNQAQVFIDSVMEEVKKVMQEEEKAKVEQEKKTSNSRFKNVIKKLFKI